MRKKKEKQSKKKKREQGIGTLEVLLAIAVFSVGTVSAVHLFLESYNASVYSVEKSKAVLLAKEGVEGVRSIGCEDLKQTKKGGIELRNNKWRVIASGDVTENKFTREIDIIFDWEGRCIIKSMVTWGSSSRFNEEVMIFDRLTPWRGFFTYKEDEGEDDEEELLPDEAADKAKEKIPEAPKGKPEDREN